MMNITNKSFFSNRPTAEIAKDLLGRELIYASPKGKVGGLIVEAEAYLGGHDRAAHAYGFRRTPSNEGLWRRGGTIYIYTQRQYYFFDIATEAADDPQGVLIRALQPSVGLEIMTQNRPIKNPFDLTNGPGKLMKALAINSKEYNLLPLEESPISIDLIHKREPKHILATPRIGVSQAQEEWAKAPLRFIVAQNPYVSRMKKREMDLQNFGWK